MKRLKTPSHTLGENLCKPHSKGLLSRICKEHLRLIDSNTNNQGMSKRHGPTFHQQRTHGWLISTFSSTSSAIREIKIKTGG